MTGSQQPSAVGPLQGVPPISPRPPETEERHPAQQRDPMRFNARLGMRSYLGSAFHVACLLATLVGIVVLGALPTAQNVLTYALRFRTNETLARDTGVVSTLVSFPVLVVVTILLGPG